jgi:hypothetical protein
MVIKLRARRSGVRIPSWAKACYFSKTPRPTLWLTHPATGWSPAFFPADKALGRDVEQPRPPTVEVKNEWSCTSPPVCLRGMERVSFTYIEYGKRVSTKNDPSPLSHLGSYLICHSDTFSAFRKLRCVRTNVDIAPLQFVAVYWGWADPSGCAV